MNKKFIITLIILIVLGIFSIIFTYNDDFIYKDEILKITSIKTSKTSSDYNDLSIKETIYTKNIRGIITNGINKNRKMTYSYEESSSSVRSEKFKVGDKVFIDKEGIASLKRDTYIVLMIVIFIIAIYVVAKIRGLLAISSVVVNTIIFTLSLDLYFKGVNLLLLVMLDEVIFTIIAIFLTTGKSKKTRVTIISIILANLVLFILSFIITKVTNYGGLNFTELEFLTVPVDDVFMGELMIGGLGAIMDIAITIVTSIDELVTNNKNITKDKLKEASKEIGKDVMGSMINVLFFTYLCSGLPVFVLALRNGFSLYNYITTNFTLEFARFLVGAIGIVVSIPITQAISLKLYKGDK
jgi:uncharacterized membrane protein